MTDIKSPVNPLSRPEEGLREAMELLFFAYRDFTAEADAILARYGFGRAHHRVVHFVGRHPRITVGELLAILKITKQSLNRVLGQLVAEGLIVQHAGPRDRRQRLLELTGKGCEIERLVSEPQRRRLARAFHDAGAPAVEGFRQVMLGIIAEESDRRRFARVAPAKR